jgi:hypothetical protein
MSDCDIGASKARPLGPTPGALSERFPCSIQITSRYNFHYLHTPGHLRIFPMPGSHSP